jgi:hypothetical protein
MAYRAITLSSRCLIAERRQSQDGIRLDEGNGCVEGEEMPAQAVRPTGTIDNNPTDQHSAKGLLKEFMKDNKDTTLTTMTSLWLVRRKLFSKKAEMKVFVFAKLLIVIFRDFIYFRPERQKVDRVYSIFYKRLFLALKR